MTEKRIFRHWVNYVALALFIGAGILLLFMPVAFAPPNFGSTGYVYLALLCLWVPFLLIFGQRGGKRYLCAHPVMILGGLFLSGFWCMVLAPAVVLPEPLRAFPMTCTEESLGDHQVRYTCVQGGSDAPVTYILEGREDFSLVWLKERGLQNDSPIFSTSTPTSAP